MQAGQITFVRTYPKTQFREALAQHAALALDLAPVTGAEVQADGFVDGSISGGVTCRARLRSLGLWSLQNLAWEVWLWASASFNTPSVVSSGLMPLGRWAFAAADGVQIAGTGAYFYYIDGLDQAYFDADKLGQIHLMLVNRSAAAKLAGDPGALQIQLGFENTLGW